MINVKGELYVKATTDGGVEITRPSFTLNGVLFEPRTFMLSGEEWRQVVDLVRRDAKIAAMLAETEVTAEIEGITWTP